MIYVETLITLPLILFFTLILWQLIDYCGAVILVKHAGIAAARAAAVVGPDNPKFYGGQARNDLSGGARLTEVRKAAQLALNSKTQFLGGSFALTIVTPGAPNAMVVAKIAVDYHCFIPWLSAVCGLSSSRTIHGTGSFPYQGALPSF